MSQSAIYHFATCPITVPLSRSDDALYFSGKIGNPIKDFLDKYKRLAKNCSLTGQQKVETIIHYIPFAL